MELKNLLLIDDDEGDLTLMETSLRKGGVKVNISTAKNGEEGMEKIPALKPVLVVLDTRLPGMDGFATCEQIKAKFMDEATVVICTGVVDAVDAGRAREVGADGYCVKTSDYQSLLAEIKQFL